MKNIVWLISLSLLFLFGIEWMNVPSLTEEDRDNIVYVLHENEPIDQIDSFPSQLPDGDKAYVDVESLARQLRVVGRGQRQLSVTYSWLSKELVNRMMKCRLDFLIQSAKHVYSSLPRQSWSISSEHYVFGLRRILI